MESNRFFFRGSGDLLDLYLFTGKLLYLHLFFFERRALDREPRLVVEESDDVWGVFKKGRRKF